MKWLNPDAPHTHTPEQRQAYWEKAHAEENYDTVWSMTEDAAVREKITQSLSTLPERRCILIPGCGSRTLLQQAIVSDVTGVEEILCTDFPRVVAMAEQQPQPPQIRYAARDSAALGFENKWDAVVIVNSILSDSDRENRAILASCYQALRPGGTLLGFFPSIFTVVDMAHVDAKQRHLLQRTNLDHNTFYEELQQIHQIFYTPLRCRMILREAGFQLQSMDIFFCDSEYFLTQSKEYYGLNDPDTVVYEHFIFAKKPMK